MLHGRSSSPVLDFHVAYAAVHVGLDQGDRVFKAAGLADLVAVVREESDVDSIDREAPVVFADFEELFLFAGVDDDFSVHGGWRWLGGMLACHSGEEMVKMGIV